MAIRTKKYTAVDGFVRVRAVKITAANLTDLVAYICRNGSAATGHLGHPEYNRPARIRIKQWTHGANWSKLDWRVAKVGDWIVRGDGPYDAFYRVKAVDFPILFTAV